MILRLLRLFRAFFEEIHGGNRGFVPIFGWNSRAEDAIQAITSAAWQQSRAAVALDIFLNCCSLLSLCYASFVLHSGAQMGTNTAPRLDFLAISPSF